MIFRVADQDDRGRIMKKITDIKPQVKTPTRCNVYLDNAFYCGLELETVMRHRLKIGDEISPGRLDEIQAESESLRALDKALGFISRSQKTKKQVADYLGISTDAVRKRCQRGQLPFHRSASRLYFSRMEIDDTILDRELLTKFA